MNTAKEREAAFRADLAELLNKHHAALDITDDGKPYGMHTAIVEITMPSEWDDDGGVISEYADFEL